ncbi:DUF6968 family protein [Microcystis aeruginosa]|uniref:DUF6968 family protein n=1 Tax=Microcystis aeruginosa TaxID=1126 RepID=UPI001881F7AA|nr:hypothetical protein [Microcystis aeruginosa]MBE8994040.1 hypothetical protein [Microcystis aeruginosa LEGE 91341]
MNNLGEIIATRHYTVLSNNKKIVVKIGKPFVYNDSQDYVCPFQIIGLQDEKIKCIFGVDSIQSLLLALKAIKSYLDSYAEQENEILSWLGGDSGDLDLEV